jgi:protoporphyrinogen oxidase
MWEEVARKIEIMGGKIIPNYVVENIITIDDKVTGIEARNTKTNELYPLSGDYFFSTMPVQELIAGMNGQVPPEVKQIAAGLQYRDFINVGVLLQKLLIELPDNWIYIQEKEVKVGRIQVYNNWGGHMVNDPNTTWLGMEYFCNKTDAFWELSDDAIKKIAIGELEQMQLAWATDVLDITVQRMEKTYPAYFGAYNQFDKIRDYTDQFDNLFLIGRNGMHKYNNTDHSMLTAMVAVDNIIAGITSKENIWTINTEQEYHEEKKHDEGEAIDNKTRTYQTQPVN